MATIDEAFIESTEDVRNLDKALHGPYPNDIKLCAIKRLVELGGEDSRDSLMRGLFIKNEMIWNESLDGLVSIWGRSYEQLVDELQSQHHKFLPIVAASALGELGDNRAVKPLMDMIKHPNDKVKKQVIASLGKLKDGQAYVLLYSHLNHKDRYIRITAARALGDLGDERGVDPLIKALSTNDIKLQYQSMLALAKLNDARAIPAITTTLDDRRLTDGVFEALEQFGERSYDSYIDILHMDDPQLRPLAIKALDHLGDKRAIEHLEKYIDSEHWEEVLEVLGRMKDDGLVEPLMQRLPLEKETKKLAQISTNLGDLADKRAIDPLVEVYSKTRFWSCDRVSRSKILTAIVKLGDGAEDRAIRALISEFMKEKESRQNDPVRWFKIKYNDCPDRFDPEKVGKMLEKHLLLDQAINLYTSLGQLEEAARIRKHQAEMGGAKVSQKVVQGDEITSIQDSVVSRSTIGSGDDLLSQLERLGALKEKGLLSENEFIKAKEKLLN